MIDAEDAELVRRFRWRLDSGTRRRPRARTSNPKGLLEGFPSPVYLEKLLAGAGRGQFVRFLNTNTLDCRRANLQIVPSRGDAFLQDRQQRHKWELEELGGTIVPARRKVDAWRYWCEGIEAEQIAAWLRTDEQTVVSDLREMAADPAVVPITEQSTA